MAYKKPGLATLVLIGMAAGILQAGWKANLTGDRLRNFLKPLLSYW